MALQHILETTGSLFESLFRMGLKPENVFLTGKYYSEHRETARELQHNYEITYLEPKPPQLLGTYEQRLDRDAMRLWEKVAGSFPDEERIIVLDDGGHLLRTVPSPLLDDYVIVGVEQTTHGVQTLSHFPVIQVATSAAKSHLEPSLVADAVFEKVEAQIESLPKAPIGVVGLGRIGEAVARGLLNHRETVHAFDKDENVSLGLEEVNRCDSLTQLVDRSGIIFGCTGRDISKDTDWISKSRGHKVLISCSSSDVEFRTLLRMVQPSEIENALAPLELEVSATGLRLTILRGGFPVNFDRTEKSVPARDIQLTRGLLAGGVLQALRSMPSDIEGSNKIALSPELQRRVVHSWIEDQPDRRKRYQEGLLEKFDSLDWIAKHSNGNLPPGTERWL